MQHIILSWLRLLQTEPEFCLYLVIGAMLEWEAQIHFLVYTWMRPAMVGKGQALDFPFSPRTRSCRGRRTPQTIKHVASQGRAAGLQLDRKVFFFLYLCGLLLVTLQSNNLQVWAINTATTASASISSGVSWVPVHEERSTERASTNTSRHTQTDTHTNIYSSSCSQSPTHTCTYIDTKTLTGWIQTWHNHRTWNTNMLSHIHTV